MRSKSLLSMFLNELDEKDEEEEEEAMMWWWRSTLLNIKVYVRMVTWIAGYSSVILKLDEYKHYHQEKKTVAHIISSPFYWTFSSSPSL